GRVGAHRIRRGSQRLRGPGPRRLHRDGGARVRPMVDDPRRAPSRLDHRRHRRRALDKLSAAFVILPLALLALLRSLKGSGPGTAVIAGSAIGALGTGVALAAPWYVRNWIRTGSPLFPFYLG